MDMVYTDDIITIALGSVLTPKYVSINYSIDKGVNWNMASFTTSILNITRCIAYNKDKRKFIAVGNNVLYSDNGKVWNARAQK